MYIYYYYFISLKIVQVPSLLSNNFIIKTNIDFLLNKNSRPHLLLGFKWFYKKLSKFLYFYEYLLTLLSYGLRILNDLINYFLQDTIFYFIF